MKLFIAYITVGQRSLDFSLTAALALIAGGANVLELGVPFSDPIADGSVIQKASQQAIDSGVTIFDVLDLAKKIRFYSDIPIILFSYYNPVLQAQVRNPNFKQQVQASGINGTLIVDLPLEESGACYNPIFVVAPSTPEARIKLITQAAKTEFIYYACQKGTTGIKQGIPPEFAKKVQLIKHHTTLPVVVGFGIATKTSAYKACEYADGFVVGSVFVDAIDKGADAKQLTSLAKSLI